MSSNYKVPPVTRTDTDSSPKGITQQSAQPTDDGDSYVQPDRPAQDYNTLHDVDAHFSDESEDERLVMDPDHPLMIRFQNSMNTHLKQRLADLDTQQRELDNRLKSKKKEREELGVILYAEQQDLARAQAMLDGYNQDLQALSTDRLVREAELNNIRKLYRTVAKTAQQSRQQVEDVHKEVDDLNARIFYLLRSHEDVSSDVKVMKRAALKTREDILKQEQEKQRQDFHINLLVELVDQKKQDIEMYKTQRIAQREETASYKSYLSEADTELKLLRDDLTNVQQNWKSTLVGMAKFDDAYSAMLNECKEEENLLLTRDKEIDAYRRSLLKSEEQHENLTYMLNRANNDIITSKKSLAKTHKRMNELKIEHSKQSSILATTESMLGQVIQVKISKSAENLSLRRQYEHAVQARNDLKVAFHSVMQQKASHSKAAKFAKHKADSTAHHISRLESDMSIDENELAQIEQELVMTELKIQYEKAELAKVKVEIDERNSQITNYERSLNQNHIIVESKQTKTDECNRMLARLLEKHDGNEVSPLENQILILTKLVRKESNNILDDQTMWVEKQYEYLKLLQDKQERDKDIKAKSRDILVLTGKKQNLNVAVEKQNKEEKELTVDMRHLRIEMEKLAQLLHDKMGIKEDLQADGYLTETVFIRELKEKEQQVMAEQDRLTFIQDEKERLLNQIVQLERQIGFWERKIQLGIEMKEAVDPKHNKNSDVHAMKCEIHRMEVRHQSLMREQERLIRGMEDCVTRREYIVSAQKAATKRDPNQLTRTRCKRRIHEAKTKVTKFKQEMVAMEKDKNKLQTDRSSLGSDLEKRKNHVISIRQQLDDLDATIQKSVLQKKQNLHELVTKQQRSTLLANVKENKYRFSCKERDQLETEMSKEQSKKAKVLEALSQLKAAYPLAAAAIDNVISIYGNTDVTIEAAPSQSSTST